MSEAGEPSGFGPVPAPGLSAGAQLRQAREAAGLHADTLAANLKVPLRKLEALEEDRFDLLGDAVFVRALASSLCRTLKIDPRPVLEKLPLTAQPRLVPDSAGINAPFRAPSDGHKPGWLDQISRPVALTVFGLLLAAVVLTFLPQREDGSSGGEVATAEPVMPPGTPPLVSPAPAEPRINDATANATAAAPAAAPAPAVRSSTALAAATVAPLAAASAPSANGATSADGIVVFRTKASSWIQVTDGAGAPVFRRLMEAGETAGASGTLPLAVTVGNTGATEVQVRGKPYNLGPVSRDNVARFEVR